MHCPNRHEPNSYHQFFEWFCWFFEIIYKAIQKSLMENFEKFSRVNDYRRFFGLGWIEICNYLQKCENQLKDFMYTYLNPEMWNIKTQNSKEK